MVLTVKVVSAGPTESVLAWYFHWGQIDDGWVCPQCTKQALPFHDASLSTSISSTIMSPNVSESSAYIHFNPRHLPILYFKARSLLPKMDELSTLCVSHKYDIIVVVETWLSACILDQELLISGYALACEERNRHSGGVAIFVAAYIPFKLLHFAHWKLKLILLESSLNSQMFTIGGFYQPPDAPADHMSKLYTTLATLPPQKFTNLVLCGDFKLDCQSDATLNQIQTDAIRYLHFEGLSVK